MKKMMRLYIEKVMRQRMKKSGETTYEKSDGTLYGK